MDLTPSLRQEILRLYADLGSRIAVARQLGITLDSVSLVLHANGVPDRKNGKRRLDHDLILRTFEELGDQHAVARKLGIHQTTVSRILRKNGIYLGRGTRLPLHPLPLDDITHRYMSGEGCREIAESYGIDPEVVRMRLRKAGVKRRIGGASGEKNPQWQGGRKDTMHFYRRQAYEVAAICFGHPLPRSWVIHHCDENPHNNNPHNLVIFPSQSSHVSFHQKLLRLRRANSQVDATLLALESGAVALPEPPHPIVFVPDTSQPDPLNNLHWPEPFRKAFAQSQENISPQ